VTDAGQTRGMTIPVLRAEQQNLPPLLTWQQVGLTGN
jgi:hypothetical protein